MSESPHPFDGAGVPEPVRPDAAAAGDRAMVGELRDEVERLRRRLDDLPTRVAQVQRELADERRVAANMSAQNERLVATLRDARDQLVGLKEELDRLATPPNTYAVFMSHAEDGLADVIVAGRKMRVAMSPQLATDDLRHGQQVLLSESMVVIGISAFESVGEIVSLSEVLPDGDRVLVLGQSDAEQVAWIAEPLRDLALRPGDSLLLDAKSGYVLERIPKSEVESLVLEEVPDMDYTRIGGLGSQIEAIRDAVELPFLHAEAFAEHKLTPPKGILLYGPPGCGKTLIAKAVAHSLAVKVGEQTGREARSFFLNIKGPELLNKYVGETERHLRLIFQRAREKASDGMPVIVFFDEMDSLFRTRGSGVSSDVETTIVPQLLSEIDGVERLDNVLVIGASNREDMIDPAILRPGRLDVKIKIERPDAEAAREVFAIYLTPDLPLHPDDLAIYGGNREACTHAMIQRTVEHMYDESAENEFLEVTYAGGDKETLYFKDFNSGAMIGNIVSRAKKMAIKEWIRTGVKGIGMNHMLAACIDEFHENEDLPNTTNPDDWARISGKKGERIVFIRTLTAGKKGNGPGRSIDTVANTGQYL
jgi:proteasome-associated ATPase